jgi:SAM-dependent methyltransferase
LGFLSHIKKTYHRNLLEKLLYKYSYLIKGKILDIGSKNRRYDHIFHGKVTAIDILPNKENNVIKGDLTDLQFESESYDSIICLEVFDYLDVNDIRIGLNEIFRILKKNGIAIISICFIYSEHDDNYRLTHDYISNLLRHMDGFKFKIMRIGNTYISIYDMFRDKIKRKKSRIFINLGLVALLLIYYLIIKLASLEKIQDEYPGGYFIICKKY